ncbi:MAG TPA: preprotein translocase subunit YajC [Tissierellales bacterium]|nr:preprotein translocase subunit YajC [Tissierellales bacterium]
MIIKEKVLWIFIVLMIIASIYSGIIIPILNRKKMKEQQEKVQRFQDKLKIGDNVLTATGIYGRIAKINKNVVSLEISKGVLINMDKSIIVGTTKDTMIN